MTNDAQTYRETRRKVAEDFTRKAREDEARVEANPGAVSFDDACRMVGVYRAIELHQSGKLKS